MFRYAVVNLRKKLCVTVPGKRIVVGENIQYWKKALIWEVPCLFATKMPTVLNGVIHKICYGLGRLVTG